MYPQKLLTGSDRGITIVIDKGYPALLPSARGDAACAVATFANDNARTSLNRFATRKCQCGNDIIGLRYLTVILNYGAEARHGHSQEYGRYGYRDHQLNKGEPLTVEEARRLSRTTKNSWLILYAHNTAISAAKFLNFRGYQ